jgi:hypothetical protein
MLLELHSDIHIANVLTNRHRRVFFWNPILVDQFVTHRKTPRLLHLLLVAPLRPPLLLLHCMLLQLLTWLSKWLVVDSMLKMEILQVFSSEYSVSDSARSIQFNSAREYSVQFQFEAFSLG